MNSNYPFVKYRLSLFTIAVLLTALALFLNQPLRAADAVDEAGKAVSNTANSVWQSIEAARLKNRTPDEIVAFFIMGILAGAVAGAMSSIKSTGWGTGGRLLLGLAGAFLGGIVIHLHHFDFGLGPVLITYEELLFSLVGAIILLFLGRFVYSKMKKKEAAH